MGRACHAIAALLAAWRLVIPAVAPAAEAAAEAACAAGPAVGGRTASPPFPEEHDGAVLLQAASGRGAAGRGPTGGPAAGGPADAPRRAVQGPASSPAVVATGQPAGGPADALRPAAPGLASVVATGQPAGGPADASRRAAPGPASGPAAAAGQPASGAAALGPPSGPADAPRRAAPAVAAAGPVRTSAAHGAGAPAAEASAAPPEAPAAVATSGGGRAHAAVLPAALLERAAQLGGLIGRRAAGAGDGGAGYAAPVFAVALVVVVACGGAYLAVGALAPSYEPCEVLTSPTAARRTVADLGQASRHSLPPAAMAASMRSLRGVPPARTAPVAAASPGAARSTASLPAAGPCGGRGGGYPWPPPGPRGLGGPREWRVGGASREDPFSLPRAGSGRSPASPAPQQAGVVLGSSPRLAPPGQDASPLGQASPRLASVASVGPRRSTSPAYGGPFESEDEPQRRSSSPPAVLWPALVAPSRGGHMEVAVLDIAAAAASGGSFFVIGPLGTKVLRALVEGPDDGRRLTLSPAGEAAAPRAVVAPSQQGRGRPDGHAELDIFGPEGKRFGVLVKRPGGPHVVRRLGQEVPAVIVNGDPGEMRLTATAGDGRPMASTSRALRTGGGPEHLQVWAQPGADTVLVLACMLSVILPM